MSPTAVTPSASSSATRPALTPIRAFRTPVRGHAFAAPPPGGSAPESGVQAVLAREPANPADPLAVAVWATPGAGQRWRIGYLDRGVAARLAPRLDAGARVRARLDGWSEEPDGRWRRPLLLLLPDEPAPDEPAPGEPVPGDPVPDEPAPQAPDRFLGRVSPEPVTRIWGRPPGVRRRRVS